MRKGSEVGDAWFDDLSRRVGMSEPQEGGAGDWVPQPSSGGGGRRNVLGSLGAAGLAMLAGLGFGELSAAAKGNKSGKENKPKSKGAKAAKKKRTKNPTSVVVGPGGPFDPESLFAGPTGPTGPTGPHGPQGDTRPKGTRVTPGRKVIPDRRGPRVPPGHRVCRVPAVSLPEARSFVTIWAAATSARVMMIVQHPLPSASAKEVPEGFQQTGFAAGLHSPRS